MQSEHYDIVILGCGPAGISAAINATIRNKKVVILGGQAGSEPLKKAVLVNNYMGFPDVSGGELENHFRAHAEKMNIEIVPEKAEMINNMGEYFSVLVGNDVISAKAVIIATGIPYKEVLPKESEFLGKGLGYCATCDGPLYRDKEVIIIGYTHEGELEANYMAEICSKVYYLPQYKGEYNLVEKVIVLDAVKAKSILGEEQVHGLELRSGETLTAEGIFIIGTATAPDRLLPGLKMEDKHIKVNREQETNIPGVYAAGDCAGAPYQIAKAAGEGQVAALNASKYVSALK